MRAHFILYVSDQERSAAFYARVLGAEPSLHVPGMTEFTLPGGAILGLMPEAGIKRLLGDAIANPAGARGIPRCELYLVVPNAEESSRRALEGGAEPLTPILLRDWGHSAGYARDPDGHVLAFAEVTTSAGAPETAP